ncbi:beta-lactamase family protein [bacterium]|nr:beta-lactamase family protein [bacterium]
MIRAGTLITLLMIFVLGARAEESEYLLGGTAPIDPELKAQLDENSDLIRLGLNTDRMLVSRISPREFIEAVLLLTDSVKDREIPGAVLYADGMMGDNMPIGIGYLITEPEKQPTEWSTLYEVGSLTGVMTVVPFALGLIESGELALDDHVEQYLQCYKGTPIGQITIEQLMRHSSGLPGFVRLPNKVRDRKGLLDFIHTIPLADDAGQRVEHSGLNFLLLGLIIENIIGQPVQSYAIDELLMPIGMANTVHDLPVHWRGRTAPAQYSDWLGRMAWGEAADPTAYILGPSAGNGGLITTADDAGIFAKLMIHSYKEGLDDLFTSDTLRMALTPDPTLEGGDSQGLGFALDGFGDGSFGWTGDTGSAMWADPHTGTVLVLLSNPNHPKWDGPIDEQYIRKVLGIVRKGVMQRGMITKLLEGAIPCTIAESP